MRRRRSKAASLITTLLVIVILSTIVIAFMQSMSIDRLTAKSARNILQAELAARAGLSSAIAQILTAIGTNNAFVTGSTNYAVDHGPLVCDRPNQSCRFHAADAIGIRAAGSSEQLPPGRLDKFTGEALFRSCRNQQHGHQRAIRRSSKAPTTIGFIARHGSSFPVHQANGSGGSPSLFSTRMQG